jgi:hypothetical protein
VRVKQGFNESPTNKRMNGRGDMPLSLASLRRESTPGLQVHKAPAANARVRVKATGALTFREQLPSPNKNAQRAVICPPPAESQDQREFQGQRRDLQANYSTRPAKTQIVFRGCVSRFALVIAGHG